MSGERFELQTGVSDPHSFYRQSGYDLNAYPLEKDYGAFNIINIIICLCNTVVQGETSCILFRKIIRSDSILFAKLGYQAVNKSGDVPDTLLYFIISKKESHSKCCMWIDLQMSQYAKLIESTRLAPCL
jgi:hypothetical protein